MVTAAHTCYSLLHHSLFNPLSLLTLLKAVPSLSLFIGTIFIWIWFPTSPEYSLTWNVLLMKNWSKLVSNRLFISQRRKFSVFEVKWSWMGWIGFHKKFLRDCGIENINRSFFLDGNIYVCLLFSPICFFIFIFCICIFLKF